MHGRSTPDNPEGPLYGMQDSITNWFAKLLDAEKTTHLLFKMMDDKDSGKDAMICIFTLIGVILVAYVAGLLRGFCLPEFSFRMSTGGSDDSGIPGFRTVRVAPVGA